MFSQATLFPQATIVSHLNPPCNVDQFSGGSREGARGGQVPTPYFFSETGPEGPKKFILETGAPPPYLRVWMTPPPPPPPYLMVWICHCSLQCLGADSRVLCI